VQSTSVLEEPRREKKKTDQESFSIKRELEKNPGGRKKGGENLIKEKKKKKDKPEKRRDRT